LSIKQLAVVTNLLKPVSCKALPVLPIFFAVASVATKASNVVMSGNYEEAKRIIETL
jgi:hypothetical protein